MYCCKVFKIADWEIYQYFIPLSLPPFHPAFPHSTLTAP